MGRFSAVGICLILLPGCAASPPPAPLWNAGPVFHDNPVFVPMGNHECVWETVVDVVDDYFTIEREDPVRSLRSVRQ